MKPNIDRVEQIWTALRNGERVGIDQLANCFDLDVNELMNVSLRYLAFSIPERTQGTRLIHAPNAQLKSFQQAFYIFFLSGLPLHEAAHGFRRNRSIVTNAQCHAAKRVILRLDLSDFFPSTSQIRVEQLLDTLGWSKSAACWLARTFCLNGGLPQGAPTSPCLSNLVNRRLDTRVNSLAHSLEATYTRYADDIVISFETDDSASIARCIRGVKEITNDFGYRINHKKTAVIRSHQQQRVTGLVVNQKPSLSRKTRRKLRAVKHAMKTGRKCSMTKAELDGWLALQTMIEKQTVTRK